MSLKPNNLVEELGNDTVKLAIITPKNRIRLSIICKMFLDLNLAVIAVSSALKVMATAIGKSGDRIVATKVMARTAKENPYNASGTDVPGMTTGRVKSKLERYMHTSLLARISDFFTGRVMTWS